MVTCAMRAEPPCEIGTGRDARSVAGIATRWSRCPRPEPGSKDGQGAVRRRHGRHQGTGPEFGPGRRRDDRHDSCCASLSGSGSGSLADRPDDGSLGLWRDHPAGESEVRPTNLTPSPWATLVPGSLSRSSSSASLLAAGTAWSPLAGSTPATNDRPAWDLIGRDHRGPDLGRRPIADADDFYARTDRDAPLGFRETCLKLLARHPIATVLALAVVPITLVPARGRASGCMILYLDRATCPSIALDYMPMPSIFATDEAPFMYARHPSLLIICSTIGSFPIAMFYQGYLRRASTRLLVRGGDTGLAVEARRGPGMDAGEGDGDASSPVLPDRATPADRRNHRDDACSRRFAIQAQWLGSIPRWGWRARNQAPPAETPPQNSLSIET